MTFKNKNRACLTASIGALALQCTISAAHAQLGNYEHVGDFGKSSPLDKTFLPDGISKGQDETPTKPTKSVLGGDFDFGSVYEMKAARKLLTKKPTQEVPVIGKLSYSRVGYSFKPISIFGGSLPDPRVQVIFDKITPTTFGDKAFFAQNQKTHWQYFCDRPVVLRGILDKQGRFHPTAIRRYKGLPMK